jgi:hypothetical protein
MRSIIVPLELTVRLWRAASFLVKATTWKPGLMLDDCMALTSFAFGVVDSLGQCSQA